MTGMLKELLEEELLEEELMKEELLEEEEEEEEEESRSLSEEDILYNTPLKNQIRKKQSLKVTINAVIII